MAYATLPNAQRAFLGSGGAGRSTAGRDADPEKPIVMGKWPLLRGPCWALDGGSGRGWWQRWWFWALGDSPGDKKNGFLWCLMMVYTNIILISYYYHTKMLNWGEDDKIWIWSGPILRLVCGLEPWNLMTFHSVGNFIIPTDEVIFFRGAETTS